MLSSFRSSFATFSPSFAHTDRALPSKVTTSSESSNSTISPDASTPSSLPTASKRPRSQGDLGDDEASDTEEDSGVFLVQRKPKKVKQYRRSYNKGAPPADHTPAQSPFHIDSGDLATEKTTTKPSKDFPRNQNEVVGVSANTFTGYIYEDQWEIKCILASRLRSRKGRKLKQYKVEWVGVDPATKRQWSPTWLPAHDVSKDVIKDYEMREFCDA